MTSVLLICIYFREVSVTHWICFIFILDSSLSAPSLTQYWTIPVPGKRENHGRKQNIGEKEDVKEIFQILIRKIESNIK